MSEHARDMDSPLEFHTVGHSNRDLAGFLELLRAHGIARIVDVRRYPGSRRHPHFARAALAEALAGEGIGYVHLGDLGGHRAPREDSPHTGLPDALRGYADHMGSPRFAAALARLLELGREAPTACLCAEARWRNCHRSLLADRLVVEGARVLHVLDAGRPEEHRLRPPARVEEGRLAYRGAEQLDLGFG